MPTSSSYLPKEFQTHKVSNFANFKDVKWGTSLLDGSVSIQKFAES